jgi:hypothetical protein
VTLIVVEIVKDVPNTAEINALKNYGIVTRPFVEQEETESGAS